MSAPIDVTFDDQVFWLQRRGGISQSFVELARALDGRADTRVHQQSRFSLNQHLGDAVASHVALPPGRLTRRLRGVSRRRLPSTGVLHHTFYEPERLADLDPARSITTVHDMIPEDLPHLAPADAHLAKREWVLGSAGIVCVSEATRARLLAHIDVGGRPVVVAHHGVGSEFRPDAPRRLALPERYVVHVGNRGGYKDGGLALRAWAAVGDPGLHLVVAGGEPLAPDELDLLAARGSQVRPTAAELPGVLAGAAAVISASRMEGFGLPVLEAMASGTPIVASRTDAHVEVAGETATWFEVGDLDGATAALERAAAGGAAALLPAARARAATFTWARSAEQVRALYALIAGGGAAS